MINKGNILKFVMILILLEACSLTAPRPSSDQSSQSANTTVNNPPVVQNTIPPAPTLAPSQPTTAAPNSGGPVDLATAQAKIKHIVIIMQENRSFDSYFGTYPGADGIPTQNGKFNVCVNDPATGKCVVPYHDPADRNTGGPHAAASATNDIDGGKMDGFIAQAEKGKAGCAATHAPDCGGGQVDVMGYHDAR